MANNINRPVKVQESKEYGGDVRTMSGGWENGYWLDRFDVYDKSGRHIARCKERSDADAIVEALNADTVSVK